MQNEHRWTLRWVILCPAVVAVLLGAGGTGADEEIWRAVFRGATEVNVVNVDVVVTGADGRPVTGLTKGDFALFAGSQQVEISNFFEVENGVALPLASSIEAGATAAVSAAHPAAQTGTNEALPQPMHLILFVDNVNLQAAHRKQVFDHLRKFLLAHRQLGARVMLMSNDRSLVVRLGFTSVPHEIFVAISELEQTAAARPRFDVDRRELLRAIESVNVEAGSGLFGTKGVAGSGLGQNTDNNSEQQALTDRAVREAAALFPQIQAYSQQRFQHTLDTLGILHQLVDAAAGLPGRKSVLYVSDGLSLKPGAAIYQAFSRRFEALPEISARVHAEAEAARDDATPPLQTLLDHANAGRVTFYTINASPAETLAYGAAESNLGSGGNFGSWNDAMASTEEHHEQHSLRLLAQGTGGRFGLSPASWDGVLQGVVTDFDNYYSLGFVAERDPDLDPRRLEVRVRGKGLEVRHRSSFQDKPLATRTAERTRAALLVDAGDNPFEVTLAIDPPELQDDGTYVVPLAVRIPLGKLVLLPGKTEHQGRVSMFVAVRDEQGRTSDVNRTLCPIRIANADVLTALGQSAACGLRLKMRPGSQRIAVSVLDELAAIDSTVHLALDVGSSAPTPEAPSSS